MQGDTSTVENLDTEAQKDKVGSLLKSSYFFVSVFFLWDGDIGKWPSHSLCKRIHLLIPIFILDKRTGQVIILVTPPFGSTHLTGTGTGRNQQVVFLFPLRHTGQNHPSARLEQGIFCLKPTLVSSSSSYWSVISHDNNLINSSIPSKVRTYSY